MLPGCPYCLYVIERPQLAARRRALSPRVGKPSWPSLLLAAPGVLPFNLTKRPPLVVQLDVNPMDESLQQPADTPPGGGLALGLPPSSGAAGGDAPARWSLDLNSSTHSDWEVVSAGHHSGCGSSPRSVSLAEAYDSEGEDGARPPGAAVLAQEAGEEGQPAAAVPVDAADDPERLPGHPLDPTREHNSAEAAEAAAAVEGEACASSAACDSPRSSFERPLSHAGGDELYSVSQVGGSGSPRLPAFTACRWWGGSPRLHALRQAAMGCCEWACELRLDTAS